MRAARTAAQHGCAPNVGRRRRHGELSRGPTCVPTKNRKRPSQQRGHPRKLLPVGTTQHTATPKLNARIIIIIFPAQSLSLLARLFRRDSQQLSKKEANKGGPDQCLRRFRSTTERDGCVRIAAPSSFDRGKVRCKQKLRMQLTASPRTAWWHLSSDLKRVRHRMPRGRGRRWEAEEKRALSSIAQERHHQRSLFSLLDALSCL